MFHVYVQGTCLVRDKHAWFDSNDKSYEDSLLIWTINFVIKQHRKLIGTICRSKMHHEEHITFEDKQYDQNVVYISVERSQIFASTNVFN